jgi:ketosteroid isomerase-like protein
MNTHPSVTESVVRNHLQTFLEQKGVDAIALDYDAGAILVGEDRTYHGRAEIRAFFEEFIASLPPGTIEQFALRALHVEGDLAYIVWSAGSAVLLGTDTFVVRNGRIVSQTFAMQRADAA